MTDTPLQPEPPQGEGPKKARKLVVLLSVAVSVVVLLVIVYYFAMRDVASTAYEVWNAIYDDLGGDTPANTDRF